MKNRRKSYRNKYTFGKYVGSLLVVTCLLVACQNREGNKTKSENKEATIMERAENTDFTLPLLNALFYEENFAQDLKEKLQLNNQQIKELKLAANTAVESLDENDDKGTNSFKQAIEQATKEIVRILGEDKAG